MTATQKRNLLDAIQKGKLPRGTTLQHITQYCYENTNITFLHHLACHGKLHGLPITAEFLAQPENPWTKSILLYVASVGGNIKRLLKNLNATTPAGIKTTCEAFKHKEPVLTAIWATHQIAKLKNSQ